MATQLGHRLLNPLPRQLRRRVREPAVQDLLRVVRRVLPVHRLRVLLHLRDQGLLTRGSRRAVQRGQQRAQERRLEAQHDVFAAPGRGCCDDGRGD